LDSTNFVNNLQKLMLDKGFKINWLELEILETDIMNNPQKTISTLE